MADITGTTADKWLAEFWSSDATVTYRALVVNPPLLDHRWEAALRRGGFDTVNIPAFTQNSSATKRTTFGTAAAITFDAITESQTQLAINTMAYKAFRYPVELEPQFLGDYVSRLSDGIGTAVALTVDTDITGDNTNGYDAFTTVVGTDNIDVTVDNILTCITNLDKNNHPQVDRFAVVSPATFQSMMLIDRFTNLNYLGSFAGQMKGEMGAGYITDLLGLHLYKSNGLEAGAAGSKNAVFQREAIAFAEQQSLKVIRDMNVEDGIIMQVVGWLTYGLKMVKNNAGNELDGK